MHNKASYKCFPELVRTDNAFCAWQVEKLCCVCSVQARACATCYIAQVTSLGKHGDSLETKFTVSLGTNH